jgi:hypothetical protein
MIYPVVFLLVTWFVPGQPPSSYQVQFSSIDACKFAADNVRLTENLFKEYSLAENDHKPVPFASLPHVSAISAPRGS